ncbi:hypothetical protein diail_911 [Diaporthe ilicicola]|nr:hypothetical protein diail_911 [Diaporthe ilicicola]
MSAFTNGAIAPPSERKKTAAACTPEPEQEDDLNETPVKVGGYLPTERVDAHVDQYSDPPESPDEHRSDVVREEGIAGFMAKVARRLRAIKCPKQKSKARRHFYDLLRQLNLDKTSKPPYSQAAAFKIRNCLEDWGLGETLLLDLEVLLHHCEEQAQKHQEEVERRAQEYKEEERKKEEWDVVNEEDADDSWEMV